MAKLICKKTTIMADGIPVGISFDFHDGDSIDVLLADFPTLIQQNWAVYGIKQKGGDLYASCEGDSARAKEMFERGLEALKSGEWGRERTAGSAALVSAIAAVKGITEDEARAALEAIPKDDREAAVKMLRKHPAIKVELARIELERATARADASDIPLDI